MNKGLLILMLSLASFTAWAQSGVIQAPGCPAGVAPGQPGCGGGGSGANSQPQVYTGPLWQDRYGAVASDRKSAGGVAQNMDSARAARKRALQQCGNQDCKVKIVVRNACLAVAWGGGVSGYGNGGSLAMAEEDAFKNCRASGGSDCKLDYSACSLPMRVQ